MGKFDDALKKARAAENPTAVKSVSRKVVEISREEIDSLRLESQSSDTELSPQQPSRDRVDPKLACLLEPNSVVAECFKTLRSKLMVCRSGKLCRAFMVIGAQPFDGKSLVAANLAVSIAQGINHHVLLVDCDLRQPTLHKIFGLQTNHGLHEYLEEGKTIAPYLLKTQVEKLTLLPAGMPMASPSELLSSRKMQLLIEELKSRYQDRYIIFDTPPAHFISDTAALAPMVDGTVLVVRSGKSLVDPVAEVVANIGKEKILGVVFNATDEVQKEHRHYYRYYAKNKE